MERDKPMERDKRWRGTSDGEGQAMESLGTEARGEAWMRLRLNPS